jgi:hypothetical protein
LSGQGWHWQAHSNCFLRVCYKNGTQEKLHELITHNQKVAQFKENSLHLCGAQRGHIGWGSTPTN